MLIPILYGVARANPEHEFTLLTQPFFANLLLEPPHNVEAMVIDTKGEERSLWGLCQYIERLVGERFDIYIDAHDVLRTKLMRWSLLLQGVRIAHLHKPRVARASLLKHSATADDYAVPPMQALYEACFREVGLRVPEQYDCITLGDGYVTEALQESFPEAWTEQRLVGIAPFASTASKTCDLEVMERVVSALSAQGCVVYLFGGRGKEASILEDWSKLYSRVYSLAGKLELAEELLLMSRLRVLVSMDSANMHFASMLGVPVVSVWCATHPAAGFLGMGQKRSDCVMAEELSCRPCSIFGKVKRCVYGDMPCRRKVTPEQILNKLLIYIE